MRLDQASMMKFINVFLFLSFMVAYVSVANFIYHNVDDVHGTISSSDFLFIIRLTIRLLQQAKPSRWTTLMTPN